MILVIELKFFTAKLSEQENFIISYKTSCYRRHFELMPKYNVGLKTLLQKGLSEPKFYGDLIYKFRKIVGKTNFSGQLNNMSLATKSLQLGCNLDIYGKLYAWLLTQL